MSAIRKPRQSSRNGSRQTIPQKLLIVKQFQLGFRISEELLDADLYDMAITRGAFQTLFTPGLMQSLDEICEFEFIKREDEMALVHPDTSKIPIWRKRPERMEHPIRAWRAWDLSVGHFNDDRVSATLLSVAMNTEWEGPVIRAHKRPVDPKYWDAHPKGSEDRDSEMYDTFEHAGIWAVKTRDQVVNDVCSVYNADVFGEVDLWGRVAQFKLGYRGELCMIKKLYVRREKLYQEFNNKRPMRWIKNKIVTKVLEELSRRYECEVELV